MPVASPLSVSRSAPRLPPRSSLATVAGGGGPIDGQDAMQFCRRQTVGEWPQSIRDTRRELARDIGQAGQRRRIDVERQLPARPRRQLVEASLDVEGGAAQIADRKPVDVQYSGIELDLGVDRARIDPGERRPADIEHERDVVRHIESAMRGRRIGKSPKRIDVEFCRVQFAVERQPAACRPPRYR